MCRFSSLLYPPFASLIGSWTWHAPWTTTHSWTQQHHTTWPDAHLIRRTTMLKKTVSFGQTDDPYHTNWAIPPTHLQSPNLIRLSTTKYIENEHELFFNFSWALVYTLYFFPHGVQGVPILTSLIWRQNGDSIKSFFVVKISTFLLWLQRSGWVWGVQIVPLLTDWRLSERDCDLCFFLTLHRVLCVFQNVWKWNAPLIMAKCYICKISGEWTDKTVSMQYIHTKSLYWHICI